MTVHGIILNIALIKKFFKKIIGRLLVSLAVFDSTFIFFIVFDFTLVRSK